MIQHILQQLDNHAGARRDVDVPRTLTVLGFDATGRGPDFDVTANVVPLSLPPKSISEVATSWVSHLLN